MEDPYYYRAGNRSDMDSTVNSGFLDNQDKYRELKTESFLGYLNKGKTEGPIPSLPDLPNPIPQTAETLNGRALYMKEASETLHQSLDPPSRLHHSPPEPHPQGYLGAQSTSDESHRHSPSASPLIPSTFTPLIINPPTATPRFSHYTLASGPEDLSDSDAFRYSGLSFGEQPLKHRVSNRLPICPT
ncbi:uncharacterized protein VP01_3182g2 [Puccinia sorghi]|uniref:Uncharacterized protein n=1 Tax=Puccinia sorghi TaxID=27349 RepID=A0A0L6V0H4_9BASI|nr:uncharacterized protein VP01_3182g2 [Puccinia sorghi]